tara:strand:+ start:349 stop:1278 length:930 start_codon:yes stop_codon:yes gene_type:complete
MTDLKKQIYQAQCIGNVEPIEYMVPYPNLRSLIDGQNIKYGEKMVYAQLGLTSDKLYRMAQQAANWFISLGVRPSDRIMLETLPFPESEVAALGAWTLGCSIIIIGDADFDGAKKATQPKLIISNTMEWMEKIKSFSEEFNPDFKSLLEDEAVVFWKNNTGIRLSHYNILVNTNGIQHAIGLYENQSFYVHIEANSMPWVVLQIVLPLYTGAPIDKENADLTFGESKSDYLIQYNWSSIKNSQPNELNVCNENTAFISIGNRPIHLTAVDDINQPKGVSGHSVMMGYLDDTINRKVFTNGELLIQDRLI